MPKRKRKRKKEKAKWEAGSSWGPPNEECYYSFILFLLHLFRFDFKRQLLWDFYLLFWSNINRCAFGYLINIKRNWVFFFLFMFFVLFSLVFMFLFLNLFNIPLDWFKYIAFDIWWSLFIIIIKTSITFWIKRYLNLNSLFNDNKLYQSN